MWRHNDIGPGRPTDSTPRSSIDPRTRAFVTVSVMLATIMQVLDTTIINVALPHMEGSLSATQDQITWMLTSYIVAAAIGTPLTGWMAGHFGRKGIFGASFVPLSQAVMLDINPPAKHSQAMAVWGMVVTIG